MHISIVSVFDILTDLLQITGLSLCGQFIISSPGSHHTAGGQIDLHLSIWKNHCTDVTAVHDHVAFSCKCLLKLYQLGAYCRLRTGIGCHIAHLLGTQISIDVFTV